MAIGPKSARLPQSHALSGDGALRDFLPEGESLPRFLTVLGRGEAMPSGAKMLGNETIRREESLGLAGGFEPLHAPLSLPRWLVGVLGTII